MVYCDSMTNMKSNSDQHLITGYLAGNEKCLEVLIQNNLKPLYSFVCRYIGDSQAAQDVVQETFVKAWKNLKKFDTQKNFKTWLFAIAKNTSVDFLRKKKAIPFSQFFNKEDDHIKDAAVAEQILVDPAPLPNEILERADLASTLNAAMEKLSAKYRMVLFLRYNDHFSFREIAETLGEPLNTIKSRHRRAIGLLKSLLTYPF